MADAERDLGTGGAAPVNATTEPPKPLPKGVVLGKDGKPCRSCSSKSAFSNWAAQTNASLKKGTSNISNTPDNCPPDVEALGRSTWTLLHSIAATYPEKPSPTQKEDLRGFMRLFSKLYPCWVCAEDFQSYMQKQQVQVAGRKEFGNWLCEAHNEVNRKLGKKEFDCSRWEERWLTGWKDGRCD
ncbi:Mitochondrial FAD-linked sulfhydryl oxidase ERV1 [Colletotrichum truncatum]|uniref:Mitochondrial FAD-linked sulfhydryl oxidase ERV1 n=1 Tax=Colletotrichum truncatum TaxID=5467 RepID=A0ACC3Z5U6_COLTU|nr:Mitochondrial FAD-linked sulfhydryl oxidase ERV1 [Colletotrichum truncatum]KAF6787270.1 Mitochondrial FAD-linked sulfhydryl oxidase ERV1 [Colletotrichum truncatum]